MSMGKQCRRPSVAEVAKAGRCSHEVRVAHVRFGQRKGEVTVFPERSTSHTKNVTNGYLDTLSFWGTKIAVQRPSDLFRVGCPHSTDSELCGHTRHVNQFHHVISQLCPKIGPLISRCFSRSTKLASRTHFCRVLQHSLEFDYPLPFKEHSTVLYSTAYDIYCYAQAEVLSLPPSLRIDNLDESKKLCSSTTKNNLTQFNGSPDS